MNKKTKSLLIFIVFALNYGLDRLTKIWAVNVLKGTPPQSFLWDTFVLKYATNDGAFLGMGGDWFLPLKLLVFIILPLGFVAYGVYYVWKKTEDKAMLICIVTIIAGGIGNLQDRILNQFQVVDFLNFGIGPVIRTGVLNIADMSITFGALALLIIEMLREHKLKQLNE